MQIVQVKTNKLRPFPGNPRKIGDDELKRLQRSIRDFDMVDPIICQAGKNIIIGGHQRWKAAQAEGLKEVPVVYIDIDDSKAQMLNVALNNPHLQGEWDWGKLGDMLTELDDGQFDLTISGFNLEEIGNLMSGLDEKIKEKEYDENLKTDNKCPECGYEW